VDVLAFEIEINQTFGKFAQFAQLPGDKGEGERSLLVRRPRGESGRSRPNIDPTDSLYRWNGTLM
jgi:hypothetical protein